MVHFHTKNTNLGKFLGPYIEKCWYIIWPFGIFWGNAGYLMTIRYIFCTLGKFFPVLGSPKAKLSSEDEERFELCEWRSFVNLEPCDIAKTDTAIGSFVLTYWEELKNYEPLCQPHTPKFEVLKSTHIQHFQNFYSSIMQNCFLGFSTEFGSSLIASVTKLAKPELSWVVHLLKLFLRK
jgi:hypothetical protein